MTHNEITQFLISVADGLIYPSREEVSSQIRNLKIAAVSRGEEKEAKELWILGTVLQIQTLYLNAFNILEDNKFYDSWCILEQCEIALHSLEKHEKARWTPFKMDFIAEYVEKWQSLFPYKMFFSPAYIEHKVECSICGTQVLPRTNCEHRLGEIYAGEMCYRIVKEAEFLEVSLVESPVQKYSVAFPNHPATGVKGDFYNYSTIEYARSAIRGPFDPWSVERTRKLWPHSHFKHVGRNDSCPCGSSKKYKMCCMLGKGVLMPHFEFSFFVRPPAGTASEILSMPSV